MRILEVIHLRMAGDDAEALADFVQTAVEDAIDSPEVRIVTAIEASELGLRLASVLRVHGLMDHSLWVGRESPGKTP